jgi:hypothetical protein
MGAMTSRTILLAVSCAALFNLPVCCCFRAAHAEESQEHRESCGHCPKKKPSSSPTQHPKDCGCPHVTRDTSADFGTLTIVPPSSPDTGEPSLAPIVTHHPGTPAVTPFLDRGPPPDREHVALYLLVLHLIL